MADFVLSVLQSRLLDWDAFVNWAVCWILENESGKGGVDEERESDYECIDR